MTEGEAEGLLENTIEEERSQICDVVRKLGPKLSGLMITCGVLVFVFGIYILIAPPDPILSVRLGIVFAAALGFIGGLNILCGLLLLLGED